jgi:hypothetical protein
MRQREEEHVLLFSVVPAANRDARRLWRRPRDARGLGSGDGRGTSGAHSGRPDPSGDGRACQERRQDAVPNGLGCDRGGRRVHRRGRPASALAHRRRSIRRASAQAGSADARVDVPRGAGCDVPLLLASHRASDAHPRPPPTGRDRRAQGRCDALDREVRRRRAADGTTGPSGWSSPWDSSPGTGS